MQQQIKTYDRQIYCNFGPRQNSGLIKTAMSLYSCFLVSNVSKIRKKIENSVINKKNKNKIHNHQQGARLLLIYIIFFSKSMEIFKFDFWKVLHRDDVNRLIRKFS